MIDTFIAFNIILLIFGFRLRIWRQSRTTFFIFVVMFIVMLEWKFNLSVEIILSTLWFFSILLFCRAVFRRFIENSRYKWFA